MKPFDASGNFHPVEVGGGLRRLAVRGAGVTVFAQGLTFAAQTVATIALARLLMPSDFGVVAMVTTFSLVLLSFGQNGYSEAIIQREKLDHALASNLFWICTGVGSLMAVIFAASGPLLVKFYGDPRVTHIAWWVSLSIFFSNLSVVHIALLKRALRFSTTSKIDVSANVLSVAASLGFALLGLGYWALVAAVVVRPIIQLLAALYVCRWTPSLPRRVPGTGSVVRFALHVYGRFSFNYTTRNTDNLLVGMRFGSASLGFYKKAYDLFLLPANQLYIPVSDVVLSTLSRLERGSAEYRRYFLNGLSVLAFVSMGAGAILTLTANDLIRLLLGEKWSPAGHIFAFFGPGVGIMLVYFTSGLIHLSIGRADRWLRWVVLEFAVTVMLFLLALRWGPVGIASAWSASFWILFIPAFIYAGKPIHFGVAPVLAVVWKYTVASLAAGVASALILGNISSLVVPQGLLPSFVRIACTSVLFVALYLLMVTILHGGPEHLFRFARLIPEMLPSSKRRKDASSPEAGSAEAAGAAAEMSRSSASNGCRDQEEVGKA